VGAVCGNSARTVLCGGRSVMGVPTAIQKASSSVLAFLSDKASQPYMTMAEVSAGFGVGESTASAKARAISGALHTNRMDPTWMLKSIVGQNPFVWMAEVNGMLVDIREMPREVQVIAYEKGMILYIPADQG